MPKSPDSNRPPVELPSADLARVKELYLQGRYRAAYEHGAAFGPPRTWAGPAGRLIAGRLAMQLGAPKMGRRLHAVAFRESPAYPEAVYYFARFRLERFGPLSCWRFTRDHTDWAEASPELRADWAALQAFVAARFRDFDRADKFLAQSEALSPNRPWHHVERASILEAQELPAEALASARRALEIQPWFRPGVQAVAHMLTRKGREAEAVEFLTEAADRLESGMVVAQLAALQLDLHQYADAARNIERFAELSPLMEPDVTEWLAARRADVTYLLGDYAAAAQHAKEVGPDDKFYTKFAERLSACPLGQGRQHRLILPLELTPVTPLSNPPAPHELFGRFWNQEAPTPAADTGVMTDGLPDVSERRRYEAGGWACREFTLTFDAATELIRRGLPFFVTLFEAGFGQPRLVLGFDTLRESLFLAEPVERKPVEAPFATITERFAVTGPRCLVAVPASHADKLAGLTLPDADQHDQLHRIQSLIDDHKLTEAKQEFDRLSANHPTHTVTKLAGLAWAKATAHPVLIYDAIDAILKEHPHDTTFGMAKANALRELGRVHERTKFLRQEGTRDEADPLLMQSYAQVLLARPHDQDEADRLLRRSVRLRPHAPAGYFLLAAQRWEHQAFAESVELHRVACCLDEREEQFAEAYVRVARATHQMPDAIRLLQRRVTRADRPNPAAVRALYHGLMERGEPDFAWTALNKAIEKLVGKPDDGRAVADLRLFKAEMSANHRRFVEAEVELTAARASASHTNWLKTAARIARAKPEYRTALGHIRELVTADPLNAELQRLYVGLIADTEGKAQARQYLNEWCQRFPSFYPALRMRAEFLIGETDDTAIRATQDLIDLCPHDAWAYRQLALVYGDLRRPDEAMAAIRRAGDYEPDHPSHFAVLANVLRRADRTDEALAAFRDGLTGMVDHDLAIAELVRTARGNKEKKVALRFVCDLLHVQQTNGEGLLAYRDQAMQLLSDPEDMETLHAELERFLDERPDLWQAWSAMTQQLIMTHRAEEAYSLAKQATARFPLLSRLWMDQAEAAQQTNHPDERIEALKQAVSAAPGWTPAAKDLADALADQDDFDEAIAVMERNLARAGTDPLAYGFLADRLWNSDRGAEAVRCAEAAVRHEPGYDWAWGAVANWTERMDRPDAALELARDLAVDRGGDARVFMKLARTLYRYEQTEEALAALDRAITLEPNNSEPYDLKAERLAEVGRFEEAIAATKPSHMLDDLPLILRGREAWIEARRSNYSAAIPMMQALVSVDPQYYWGWSQLAEWYNDIGKSEAYLEATDEMLRLRPDHPTPLAMRGEAKLQTGDREGGKADLREALRIHPGHSPAAAILFDACLADNELREARAALSVLQEHMTGAEVVVKQLIYATRTKDEEGAARAFADVCATAGEESPSSVQMALGVMKEAGYEDRAAQLMGEAWKGEEPFSPWVGLFWLDTPAAEEAEADERLAACDAVIRAYPSFIPAYDRKAEQLARLGRFDEATAACAAVPNIPQPLTLQGRAAWVEATRGEKEKAVELMAACLREDPDYTWGWRQQAHWYDELGRPSDCLEAAEHLVRLAPHDPYAHGIRGEAKRILGDHRGARDDFQRAFDLDPNFDAAGHQLMNEQLSIDDIGGATRTLAALREHSDSSGPLLQLRAVQLAARQKDLNQSRVALRAVATAPEVSRKLLRDAAKALDEEGWTTEADEELAAVLEGDDCTPAAAAVWAERHFAAGNGWKVGDRLKGLAEKNPTAGREAVLVYAWAMAVTGQPETATASVQRFAELIRQTDDGWGRAGAVLAESRKYPLAVAWLQDWKQRPGCEPWMLRALADAHRANGDDTAARGVLHAAAELAETTGEEVPDDLRAWFALDEVLTGNTDAAREHLALIDPTGQPDPVKLLMTLARAVLTVRQSADTKAAFAEAKADIRSVADACPVAELPPGIGPIYQKVVRAIATAVGGLRASLWALWQRVRPWVNGGPIGS